MKRNLINYICCPETGSNLQIINEEATSSGEIITGELVNNIGKKYPIINGIPRFANLSENSHEKQTVKAFGKEWAFFDKFSGYVNSNALLFEFIYPINKDDIKGKVVVELGCGGGRWLERLADCEAAKIIGIDLSGSVEQAYHLTKKYQNVDIIQASIFHAPLIKNMFDMVFSIGVIHHLKDPIVGLRSGLCLLKQGGRFSFWVYSKEGNESFLIVLTLLRKITPFLPIYILIPISSFFAIPIYFYAKMIRPLFSRKQSTQSYFDLLKKLRFIDIVNMIYDQLTPSIAFYPTRDEVKEWVKRAGGGIEHISMRTNNSWRLLISPLLNEQLRNKN